MKHSVTIRPIHRSESISRLIWVVKLWYTTKIFTQEHVLRSDHNPMSYFPNCEQNISNLVTSQIFHFMVKFVLYL